MSTGAEPPEDDPNARRNQDRDTEPIPRARPESRPEARPEPIAEPYTAAHADYTVDSEDLASDSYSDPLTDGAYARSSGGRQYADTAPPTFSQDEFARLQGGDTGPSVPPGSRMAPLEDEASRHASRYLFPTEKFRGEWKRHWIQLAKEGLIAIFATIAMGYIAGWLTKHNQTQLRTAVLIIWALVIVWCAWRVADWWYDRFILTNKRVMVVSGIFTRNVAMMPLLRVTDMKYVQSLTGRMFGYGHFELESAGQDQALRNIRNLPNPNELYLRIVEEMYEPEAVEARLGRAASGEDDGT
jgi:membrane protein YdbS with pleckstrin-like domain